MKPRQGLAKPQLVAVLASLPKEATKVLWTAWAGKAAIYQSGAGATLESLGNNNMRQNGANTGSITTVSPS